MSQKRYAHISYEFMHTNVNNEMQTVHMQRHLVKYLQGCRNVREVCKKSGRIYVQSNTVTERKFHFKIKSVVTESRGSHINAFPLPKTTL